MDADFINAPGLPPPGGHYSHAVRANGFLFVSGLLPVTPEGRRLADEPFEVQAQQVLDNLGRVLQAGGSGIARLVQVRVYVDDIAHWPAFDAIYARWAQAARPARAVVPSRSLHHGLKIEVEAVALAAT